MSLWPLRIRNERKRRTAGGDGYSSNYTVPNYGAVGNTGITVDIELMDPADKVELADTVNYELKHPADIELMDSADNHKSYLADNTEVRSYIDINEGKRLNKNSRKKQAQNYRTNCRIDNRTVFNSCIATRLIIKGVKIWKIIKLFKKPLFINLIFLDLILRFGTAECHEYDTNLVHTNLHRDSLANAYKDHMVHNGQMVNGGRYDDYFGGGARNDAYSSKSLYEQYDKFGRRLEGQGLISPNGYVSKSGLNKILGSSLESGLSVEEAVGNARSNAFNTGLATNPSMYGSTSEGLGTFGGTSIKGYNPSATESLVGSDNSKIVKNINCNFPSSGYGHSYCGDDRVVGEHYDLTNRKGPYTINAHFESPSKTQQSLQNLSYHPSAYKDAITAKRTGFSENDLLQVKMNKCKIGAICRMKFPTHRSGVERYVTPADEFHEI